MQPRWIMAFALAAAAPTFAQAPAGAPVTVEHYYRIKWGSADEFRDLYKRNHQPLLDEMKRQGFIINMVTEMPFTHMAGDQRWDMRVRITYRDAEAAVGKGGAFDKAYDAAFKRLYPDEKKLEAEEVARFRLLEEHWDVIVNTAGD